MVIVSGRLNVEMRVRSWNWTWVHLLSKQPLLPLNRGSSGYNFFIIISFLPNLWVKSMFCPRLHGLASIFIKGKSVVLYLIVLLRKITERWRCEIYPMSLSSLAFWETICCKDINIYPALGSRVLDRREKSPAPSGNRTYDLARFCSPDVCSTTVLQPLPKVEA